MKRILLALCLALCLLLCGCASLLPDPVSEARATLVPGTSDAIPEAAPPEDAAQQTEAVLFFRFQNEPYLAAESRLIRFAPNESFERALIQALLQGPSSRSDELNAAFPEGVELISAVSQGRTLFVTLSRALTAGWSDEPAIWRSDPYWQEEMPLRRQLCIQSLVATVTENCDYDSVEVLVEQQGMVSDSLRLRQSFFLDGSDDTLLAPPQTRSDSLILTPAATLKAVLEAWKNRDWTTLYLYIAAGSDHLGLTAFIQRMEQAPALMAYGFSGGSLSPDGRRATYALHVSWRDSSGSVRETSGCILRLTRTDCLWKVTMTQLLGWTEGV